MDWLISFTGMKITETQKAIKEGRDEYLEKALELLK